MEENERLERRDQRAQMARSTDFARLHRRKLERQIVTTRQLQSRSKQQQSSTRSLPVSDASSLDSSAFTMTVSRPAPVPQLEKNKWTDLDPLPVQQIRKFLPKYELDLDASTVYVEATAILLAKRAHFQAVQQAKETRKRELRDEQRMALVMRHQATEEVGGMQLERKAGVIKYRATVDPMASTVSSQSSIGPYGFTRVSQHSPRSEAFAQPRSPFLPKDPLLYSEFRGLIQKENPEAVRKMRSMFSSRASTLSSSQLSISDLTKQKKSSLPSTPKGSSD